ncbi:unnamed protein product [Triticum turgidum subsp. durum]|uniref:Uncharacterized protein n=1 Tax=Triticum turgidum subsp. durum TaxID=4567 RepID=A0A9R0Z339_TRITD|nr:unnamed protein product [Triticum turgidum subsp. durum]
MELGKVYSSKRKKSWAKRYHDRPTSSRTEGGTRIALPNWDKSIDCTFGEQTAPQQNLQYDLTKRDSFTEHTSCKTKNDGCRALILGYYRLTQDEHVEIWTQKPRTNQRQQQKTQRHPIPWRSSASQKLQIRNPRLPKPRIAGEFGSEKAQIRRPPLPKISPKSPGG